MFLCLCCVLSGLDANISSLFSRVDKAKYWGKNRSLFARVNCLKLLSFSMKQIKDNFWYLE